MFESSDLFRVLVTGSRDWPWLRRGMIGLTLDYAYCEAVDLGRKLVLVHGACPSGADYFAKGWGLEMKRMGFDILIDPHPANWTKFGKAAGPIRNSEMVKLGADVCLAFIHNKSNGASNCADLAEKADIQTIRFTSSSRRTA